MRMDLAEREVPIHITEGIAVPGPQLPNDQLQGTGVGTLVVAVDQDRHRPRTTDVVVFLDSQRHAVSLANSWRNAGATCVPSASMARMSLAWGREEAFIWKVMREIPPNASLCRMIFSTTSS